MSKQEEPVKVQVCLNQQQRQLLEKIKRETRMGDTDAEVIRAVFAQWLQEEGLL